MISYEVAMGLSLVAVFLYAGSMSTSEIVAAQAEPVGRPVRRGHPDPALVRVLAVPSFLIYMISMVGETNRAPFDLPEAEGELVGGFHTEYSSIKFALFFLAEYINMVTVSALATTLFLGGWRAPWPLSLWDGANEGYWPVLWFLGKVMLLHLLLHLAARHAAAAALRPVHGLGWKVPDPGLAGLDPAGRHRPRGRAGRPTFSRIDRCWWPRSAWSSLRRDRRSCSVAAEAEAPTRRTEDDRRRSFDAFAGGYPGAPTARHDAEPSELSIRSTEGSRG